MPIDQLKNITKLASTLTPLQLSWLGGYFTAQANALDTAPNLALMPTAQETIQESITILYASQTGNGKKLAEDLALKLSNHKANVCSLDSYKVKQLIDENIVIFVISTHGEGEIPDDALMLQQYLLASKKPDLTNLKYTIVSLGDSSYEFFCQAGKEFDSLLSKCGAKTFLPRTDLDVDYKDKQNSLFDTLNNTILSLIPPSTSVQTYSNGVIPITPISEVVYDKSNPFMAEVLINQKITGTDALKDIFHLELDISGSNINYEAGDTVGILFNNDIKLVDEIINALKLDKADADLTKALITKKELTQINAKLLHAWSRLNTDKKLQKIISNDHKTREFILEHQLIDLINLFPITIDANAFLELLTDINPRLYSIASSKAVVGEEIHLAVSLVNKVINDKPRFGGASYFLKRTQVGDKVGIYVIPNHNFKLPKTPRPIIMFGAGTGIAPFRAFTQEISVNNQANKSWLFFGNQNVELDFLYQLEWQSYLNDKVLTKIDVAFSRDQKQKTYLQDLVRLNGAELYNWLDEGTNMYICGSKIMADAVHEALLEIIITHGEKTPSEAAEFLTTMRTNKHYQKDVY